MSLRMGRSGPRAYSRQSLRRKMSQNIAIIGSGFLGMTLALRLAEQGRNVTVFEAAGEIGGLASSWKIGDHVWDKHYHVTLMSDEHTRKLVEDLGLGDQFRWVETKTGFYTDGSLVSMSNTADTPITSSSAPTTHAKTFSARLSQRRT